jgi:hypothetical protein
MNNQLDDLIAATKGKFFSITFTKKDGTSRTINGKNRYNRLVKGVGSPATTALKERGYCSFVNRNASGWVSAHKENVLTFKCGKIEETFVMI